MSVPAERARARRRWMACNTSAGWAMNASHNRDDVPAHRVVNRKGLLTGKMHFDGTNLMQQLLESEGVEVVENQIINFESHFWNPETSV